MMTTPFFIFPMASASMMWRVSSVSGQCSEMMSLRSSSSSRVTYSMSLSLAGNRS